jgi:hypothetical protein
VDNLIPDHPPEPPDLSPDLVRRLGEFSRQWAEWLENDYMMAELHGHVITRQQTLTAEGWRFMEQLFEEWDL